MKEEILTTVPQSEIRELLRLMTSIECPDVTYCDDLLPMAQQAVRLSKMRASEASDILYKWLPKPDIIGELENGVRFNLTPEWERRYD